MLIDAFTYFNERELVELRLKYLNPIVDYFVVKSIVLFWVLNGQLQTICNQYKRVGLRRNLYIKKFHPF